MGAIAGARNRKMVALPIYPVLFGDRQEVAVRGNLEKRQNPLAVGFLSRVSFCHPAGFQSLFFSRHTVLFAHFAFSMAADFHRYCLLLVPAQKGSKKPGLCPVALPRLFQLPGTETARSIQAILRVLSVSEKHL